MCILEREIFFASSMCVEPFIALRNKSGRLQIFIMDYKKTYEELNVLLPFSPDVKVQQDQQEKMAVMGFLASLSFEYDYVKT